MALRCVQVSLKYGKAILAVTAKGQHIFQRTPIVVAFIQKPYYIKDHNKGTSRGEQVN